MGQSRTEVAIVALSLCGLWWLTAGCREQPPVPGSPQKPTAQADREPDREPAAGDRLAARPPGQLAPPPSEPPEPQDPFHLSFELATPDTKQRGWVRVMKFFNQGPPAGVEAHWEGPNRITIDTQNVQLLSLDLGQLPVDRRKSVVLRLNGQGIQLSSGHGPVVQFERGQAGTWRLLRD